jgi:hypothetical protein
MKTTRAPLTLAALAAVALACASNPKPGESGYPYNVAGSYAGSFVVDGVTYTGPVESSTAPGGTVDGRFTLSPAGIEGTFTGMIVADSLSWSGPYTIRENGCTGTATGQGAIAEGGGAVSGTMRVEDSCGGPLTGSFSFTR